jgi:hypothetical protein
MRRQRMNTNLVGQWYLRRDLDEIFQVTSYDDRFGTIAIQTFEGDIDEIEEENWRALSLMPVEAPTDWTGPLDGVEFERADSSDEGGEDTVDVSSGTQTWQDLAADDGPDIDEDEWESEWGHRIPPNALAAHRRRPDLN